MWSETEKHYAPIVQSTATIPITDYEQFKKDAIELRKVKKEIAQIKKDKSIAVNFSISHTNQRHPITSRFIGFLNKPTIEIGEKLEGVKEELQAQLKAWWQGAHFVYTKEDLGLDIQNARTNKAVEELSANAASQFFQLQEYFANLPSWVKWLYPLKIK